jgi:hypothetical protein
MWKLQLEMGIVYLELPAHLLEFQTIQNDVLFTFITY